MSAPHDETHEMHSEVATVARAMLSAGLAQLPWSTRGGNGNCAPPATRSGHYRRRCAPNPPRTGRAPPTPSVPPTPPPPNTSTSRSRRSRQYDRGPMARCPPRPGSAAATFSNTQTRWPRPPAAVSTTPGCAVWTAPPGCCSGAWPPPAPSRTGPTAPRRCPPTPGTGTRARCCAPWPRTRWAPQRPTPTPRRTGTPTR